MMTRPVLVAPSVLGADLMNIQREAESAESAGADWLHVDVMDGRFVPPISFGEVIVSGLRGVTRLPLDTHLMIIEPEKHIDSFKKAGSSGLTFHLEASPDPLALLDEVSSKGMRNGLSINPETPVEAVYPFLDHCNLVLIMSVNPGWGGQGFIEKSVERISRLRREIDRRGLNVVLQVDGGLNTETARRCRDAGANCLVAGTFVFRHGDRRAAIESLRGKNA